MYNKVVFDMKTWGLHVRPFPLLRPSRWLHSMHWPSFKRVCPCLWNSSTFLFRFFLPVQTNYDGWGLLINGYYMTLSKIKDTLTSGLHRGKKTLIAQCSCSAYWTVLFSASLFYFLSAFLVIAPGLLSCF